MPHSIDTTSTGQIRIITPAGNPARTTSGAVYLAADMAEAEEVRAFLSQEVTGMGKRIGAHWLKSAFGVF